MKKVFLLLSTIALLISCQKEQINDDITSDLSSEIIDTEKYFGVFVSNDLELHGEIRTQKVNNSHYTATVKLLNSDVLEFRGAINNLSNDVLFTGNRGSFTINFSDENNMVSSQFKVDDKEGTVKAYKDRGVGGGILFGIYVSDTHAGYTGTWDMVTFGTPDPLHPGFLMIDDIFLTHRGIYFSPDMTAGIYEPFEDFCLVGGPFIGASTDGFAVVGVDQVSTFFGKECIWSMVSLPGLGIDPITCLELPTDVHGVWDWNGRSGSITRMDFPTLN